MFLSIAFPTIARPKDLGRATPRVRANAAGTGHGVAVTGFSEPTLGTRDAAALDRFYGNVLGFGRISTEPGRICLAVGSRARLGRREASVSAGWR
jgi:hypothetical protein